MAKNRRRRRASRRGTQGGTIRRPAPKPAGQPRPKYPSVEPSGPLGAPEQSGRPLVTDRVAYTVEPVFPEGDPTNSGACAVSWGPDRRNPAASCVAAPTAVYTSPRWAAPSSSDTVCPTTGREEWLVSSCFRTRGNLIANLRSDARRSRVGPSGPSAARCAWHGR
jgi:hypothetical protein